MKVLIFFFSQSNSSPCNRPELDVLAVLASFSYLDLTYNVESLLIVEINIFWLGFLFRLDVHESVNSDLVKCLLNDFFFFLLSLT